MNEAKAIKKHAAQHDLFNRIHSIAADEQFVRKVAQDWFDSRFPVVANQRCGTWYCDPETSSSAYAYFKSTDGHTLNWDFNLRRSNLPFASYAESCGGVLLVDSTRRGKRMPDGLSKTVPIWCSVVNRALKLRHSRGGVDSFDTAQWDTALYLPGQIVSPSERSQIESRIDSWAALLEASVLPLPNLTKPLRPFFIHPASSFPPEIPNDAPYTPIICVSASRWVNDGKGSGDPIPTATRLGNGWFARTVAFDYVPGAGDDDELWGRGLKPSVYHKHKGDLLSTTREDLPDMVDQLVEDTNDLGDALGDLQLEDNTETGTNKLWTEAVGIAPALRLDLGETSQPAPTFKSVEITSRLTIRVVEVDKPLKDTPSVLPLNSADGQVLVFAAPTARAKPKEFLSSMDALVAYLSGLKGLGSDTAVLISPGSTEELDAALAQCHAVQTTGDQSPRLNFSNFASARQLSVPDLQTARKLIIPIVVALQCSLPALALEPIDEYDIDKAAIAERLHALVALWPSGNPPRAALKRVNEFLMSERV